MTFQARSASTTRRVLLALALVLGTLSMLAVSRAEPETKAEAVLIPVTGAIGPATSDFFVRRLGFVVSDSYPGHAAFLRARTPGSHHDAFILSRPGRPGLNHVAFTVSNIHEVFGGGLAINPRIVEIRELRRGMIAPDGSICHAGDVNASFLSQLRLGPILIQPMR